MISSKRNFYAPQKYFHIKRFRNIILCAEVKPLQNILFQIIRCQKYDWHLRTHLFYSTARNEKIIVTSNEYKLLKVLTENARNILTRQMLLERLWDMEGNFVDDHALTVTINRLRDKIEDDTHTYIKTVRGIGYVWTGGTV